MGCTSSVQDAGQPVFAPSHAAQARQRPAPQGQSQLPAQAQQNTQADVNKVAAAPVVRSLVSLQRDSCKMEKTPEGVALRFLLSAVGPGVARAFFLADPASKDDAVDFETPQKASVEEVRFEGGNSQTLRIALGSQPHAEAETEADTYQVILDLTSDSSDDRAVTAQRNCLQLSPASEVHVLKQLVRCGQVVRILEALYGTLPNPRMLGGAESAGGGGECVICLEKPREVAILHCRHVCLCLACAKITSSTWSFQCPVCRGRVAGMVGVDQLPEAGA